MREIIGGSPPALVCAFPFRTDRTRRLQAAALYSAFAVIAAVVFGTLSVPSVLAPTISSPS